MFRKSRGENNSLYFVVSDALLLNYFIIIFINAAVAAVLYRMKAKRPWNNVGTFHWSLKCATNPWNNVLHTNNKSTSTSYKHYKSNANCDIHTPVPNKPKMVTADLMSTFHTKFQHKWSIMTHSCDEKPLNLSDHILIFETLQRRHLAIAKINVCTQL